MSIAAIQPPIELQPHWDESKGLRVPNIPHSSARHPFPRHIFQTCKSKTQLSEKYAGWSESVRVKNADFDYFLWDDLDNRRFIAECYPWFLAIYDAYPREIFRVDAVRYFFMYQFGGAYLDMDTECLKPLAPLFDSSTDVWLGRMGDDADFLHSIPNAIMASRPLQEFWLLAIYFLAENATTIRGSQAQVLAGPEIMTGPVLLKKTYDTYVSGEPDAVREMIRGVAALLPVSLHPEPKVSTITLLNPNSWYPMNWANVIHAHLLWELWNNTIELGDRHKRWLFPESYLVTYWGHSWKAAR